ncbi:MAG: transcriptional regulator, GntR family [Aeromicrobium sp.]|nr:transcriptional regulator, GntR family [Aeromicrobium sp.]
MSQPIAHKTLREAVADALREMIFNGELKAGDRLVEDRLAERLGVSRNPIREGIRAMEAIGLVTVVPRRGAYVASIDADDVQRIQEVRRVVEGWIVATAAERHDAEDLARIDEWLVIGARASRTHDRVVATEAHRGFHLGLEAATKNHYVSVMMAPLRQRTELVFSVLAGRPQGSHHWGEHKNIRDAVAARDAELARKLIDEHIGRAMARFSLPGKKQSTA